MIRKIRFAAFVLLCICAIASAQSAAEKKAADAVDKGLEYLKAQQKPDFSWQGPSDPSGISALVLRAFMGDKKYDAEMPFLDKGFGKLLSYQQPDGGIYNGMLANYNTAIAVSAIVVCSPVAKRTSTSRTCWPGATPSRWISSVSVPYSNS